MKLVLVNLAECSYCEKLEKLFEPIDPILIDIRKEEDRDWLRDMRNSGKLYEIPQAFVLIDEDNDNNEAKVDDKCEIPYKESLIH